MAIFELLDDSSESSIGRLGRFPARLPSLAVAAAALLLALTWIGISPAQAQSSGAPVVDETSPPGRATGLSAVATHTQVTLSWSAPGDGGTVTGYRILRAVI